MKILPRPPYPKLFAIDGDSHQQPLTQSSPPTLHVSCLASFPGHPPASHFHCTVLLQQKEVSLGEKPTLMDPSDPVASEAEAGLLSPAWRPAWANGSPIKETHIWLCTALKLRVLQKVFGGCMGKVPYPNSSGRSPSWSWGVRGAPGLWCWGSACARRETIIHFLLSTQPIDWQLPQHGSGEDNLEVPSLT